MNYTRTLRLQEESYIYISKISTTISLFTSCTIKAFRLFNLVKKHQLGVKTCFLASPSTHNAIFTFGCVSFTFFNKWLYHLNTVYHLIAATSGLEALYVFLADVKEPVAVSYDAKRSALVIGGKFWGQTPFDLHESAQFWMKVTLLWFSALLPFMVVRVKWIHFRADA